jgi:hypothetical protein
MDGWYPEAETFPKAPDFDSLSIFETWISRLRLEEEAFELPYWLMNDSKKGENPFQRQPKDSETETSKEES